MPSILTMLGGIRRSGVTIENEPIIRSDGAGEIMQWQPSDGAADGIYITESVEDGPAFIGVGAAVPKAPIHVKMSGTNWEDSLLLEKSSGNTGWNFLPGNSGNNDLWIGYNANTAAALTSQAATAALKISSNGSVTIESNDVSDQFVITNADLVQKFV